MVGNPGDRPCDHSTIKLSKRRFFVGPHVTFWRCIKCDMDFNEQWKSGFELVMEAEREARANYVITEEP